MAKISARGATKVAEIKATREAVNWTATFVMCSDGRILRKFQGEGYNVMLKVAKSKATRETMAFYVSQWGWEEIPS